MTFINLQSGKPIEEETVLLKLGVKLSSGNQWKLTENVRRAVREMAGKEIQMEFGRPQQKDLADQAWIARVNEIRLSRVCGLVSDVRLIEDRESPGKAVIVGTVKPHGPFGVHLRDLMVGRESTHSYGVRAFARAVADEPSVRTIDRIVTFDVIRAK